MKQVRRGGTGLPELRAEVEAAILAALGAAGPDRLGQAGIVKRFMDRGASRATLFRWTRAGIMAGGSAQRVAGPGRARMSAAPAADMAAAEAPRALWPSPAVATTLSSDGMAAFEDLARIMADVDAAAPPGDGQAREATLLLRKAAGLCATLKAATRRARAMTDDLQAMRLGQIRQASPPGSCGRCALFETNATGYGRCSGFKERLQPADPGCRVHLPA